MDGNGGIVGVKNAGQSGRWNARDVFLDRNIIRTRDVTAGLVNRWKLTENVSDIAGGLPLANNGAVPFGVSGATFNGTDQWLACTKTWSADFTVSVWMKCSDATLRYVFGAAANDGSNSFNPCHVDFDMGLGVGAQYVIPSGRNLADSTWHLIAVDGHSTGAVMWRFYIDGVLEGTFTPTNFTLDSNLSFGRTGLYANNLFVGNELDARIYSRHLTEAEHAALYAAGPNPE